MPLPTLNPVADDGIISACDGHRRQTIAPPPVTASPELQARPRRRCTAQEKLRILAETDRALRKGEIGAVLRRELVCASLLTDGRRRWERVHSLPTKPDPDTSRYRAE